MEQPPPFKVWKIDTKVRPCFGTRENDKSKQYRSQVGEIQKRVIAILETLKRVGIPLNIGAMIYSNIKWMNSKTGFHIKYSMPPDVYLSSFWPNYYKEEVSAKTKPPDKKDLEESFAIDYYGNYLHLLCDYGESDLEKLTSKEGVCIRAKNSLLMNTGPVVLWNEGSLACDKLTDEHLSNFEKVLVSIFDRKPSREEDNSEDFGFSVCIFVTEHDESPSKAKICIGAKIDEKRFIETIRIQTREPITEELKDSFLTAYKYKKKDIKYQKEYEKKPALKLSRRKY